MVPVDARKKRRGEENQEVEKTTDDGGQSQGT
jgi:hypothetical protein